LGWSHPPKPASSDIKTGQSIWDQSFMRDEPAGGKTIEEVVASMDRNLQQVASQAATAVGQAVGQASTPAAGL
jgi:hypothetical protein